MRNSECCALEIILTKNSATLAAIRRGAHRYRLGKQAKNRTFRRSVLSQNSSKEFCKRHTILRTSHRVQALLASLLCGPELLAYLNPFVLLAPISQVPLMRISGTVGPSCAGAQAERQVRVTTASKKLDKRRNNVMGNLGCILRKQHVLEVIVIRNKSL